MDALAIKRITVASDRIGILTELSSDSPRESTPELARVLLAAYPELKIHRCANDAGPLLISVLGDTSIPHILEHLIISEQARDPRTPYGVALVGATEWLNRREGTARIEIGFTDDLVALEAIRRAHAFLNEVLRRGVCTNRGNGR